MTARVHMSVERAGATLPSSLCGVLGVTTRERALVTCRLCLRRLAPVEDHGAMLDELDAIERPAVIGARDVGEHGARAIERSLRGEDSEQPHARFRSWRALHEQHARVVDDGSPVRSTTDPSRFSGRVSSGGAVRTPGGRDDMVEIDLVLERATAAVRVVGGREVTGAMQRAIYLARMEGRPLEVAIAAGRKGRIVRRASLSAAQIAERLGDEWTAHQVGLVVRWVREAMEPVLVEKGLLPARDERVESEDAMRVPGMDLEGWGEVAGHLGVSERTARRLARRSAVEECDPLPVHRVPGGTTAVRASRAELDRWRARRVGALGETGAEGAA